MWRQSSTTAKCNKGPQRTQKRALKALNSPCAPRFYQRHGIVSIQYLIKPCNFTGAVQQTGSEQDGEAVYLHNAYKIVQSIGPVEVKGVRCLFCGTS